LKTSLPLGEGIIKRNAPSLLNAALQSWQFYDMRTTNLENQSSDVIGNTDEMHGDLAKAITTITNDASYRDLISKAFPAADAISEKHVQNALATYVRSLTALNSRFDTYMRSESGEGISAEEKQGFNLFMGKAKCGSCHFMPLFNGTVPPAFIKMESEVLGVPSKNGGKVLDSDSGRYLIYKLQPYLHAFKTTTVRNAALTAPYMHNGIYNTLEEVVDFYNDGGGKGAGISVDNQTLPGDKLDLSATEKKALIRFIEALTDTASYK
jgi:cytochrome c peroxidase